MRQDTPVLVTCEVNFRPHSEVGRQRIKSIAAQVVQSVHTTAGWRFSKDKFLITGSGFDGRCSVCRGIRQKAKSEGLLFSSRCRYETDDEFAWRVRVGTSSYDITLLESEDYYLKRKAVNPNDVLVRTHLGLIAELKGELARALAEYFAVLRLCPSDKFTFRRVKEVSRQLLSQKRVGSANLIASS